MKILVRADRSGAELRPIVDHLRLPLIPIAGIDKLPLSREVSIEAISSRPPLATMFASSTAATSAGKAARTLASNGADSKAMAATAFRKETRFIEVSRFDGSS